MNKLQLKKDRYGIAYRYWLTKEQTGEKRGRWEGWDMAPEGQELAYLVLYEAMSELGLVDVRIELDPFKEE